MLYKNKDYSMTYAREALPLQSQITAAIANGDKEIVSLILKENPSLLNATLDKDYTTLAHAIRLNKKDIVELLLSFNELSLKTGDDYYPEAEDYAVSLKRYEVAQLISNFKEKKATNLGVEDIGKTEDLFVVENESRVEKELNINLSQINTREELFSCLVNINTKGGPQLKSNSWATSYGINQALEHWLKDTAHIINTELSSVETPVSSKEGAVNYAKKIVGYKDSDGEEHDTGFVHKDGGVLKKPIVMIINTNTVQAASKIDVLAEGGTHWQCCVIFPKQYKPFFDKELNNEEERVFYLDSLYPDTKIPEMFKQILTQGTSYIFNSDKGSGDEEIIHNISHEIPALNKKITFIDDLTTNQQEGGGRLWLVGII